MESGYSWPTKNSFTTNELSIQLDATDLSKQNESKTCRVCGDVARCYHFGGLCCASCKAFFRRAVANDHYKPYRCVFGGSCRIDITTRKHCSHCRLKRCLAIGMDKKWFMSEEKRAELKRKRAGQNTASSHNQREAVNKIRNPQPGDYQVKSTSLLTFQHMSEIQMLIQLYHRACKNVIVPIELINRRRRNINTSPAPTAMIFTSVIGRTLTFLQSVPQFQRLPLTRRVDLLNQRVVEALIVLASLHFDPIERGWNNCGRGIVPAPCPMYVTESDLDELHGEAVKKKQFDSTNSLLSLHPDEPILVLLSLIAFFMLDEKSRAAAFEAAEISGIQLYFTKLLKHYVHWKFGPIGCDELYPQYIQQLLKVREASHLHQATPLRLSDDEIHQIGINLGGLTLRNSY